MVGLYDTPRGFARAIELYRRPDGFLRDRDRLIGMAIRVDSGSRAAVFDGLAPGRYAIVLFQDANSDGRLDRNLIGVPTEGYGFSNNVRGLLGAPDFDAAAVPFDGRDKTITVRLTC